MHRLDEEAMILIDLPTHLQEKITVILKTEQLDMFSRVSKHFSKECMARLIKLRMVKGVYIQLVRDTVALFPLSKTKVPVSYWNLSSSQTVIKEGFLARHPGCFDTRKINVTVSETKISFKYTVNENEKHTIVFHPRNETSGSMGSRRSYCVSPIEIIKKADFDLEW